MKILITGGCGYIGSVMTGELLKEGHSVRVVDRMFFGQTIKPYKENKNLEVIREDIRYFDQDLLRGVDAVIELAGISNDPSCDLNPEVSKDINHLGCFRVASLAKKMGVKRYIFASSCSVYGNGATDQLTEESPTQPVSLYAQTKLNAEEDILVLADRNFSVTILRSATIYGFSPRMRFDLMVNAMTMNAWKNRKIYVLGGKQWRPLVHVKDMVDAFMLVIQAETRKINGQIFNVGSNLQNYQAIQVANIVRDVIPYVKLEIIPDDLDKRNYNVCFDKIHNQLGFTVKQTVREGIVEIRQCLENGVIDPEGVRTITRKYYQYLLEAEKIIKEVSYKGKIF